MMGVLAGRTVAAATCLLLGLLALAACQERPPLELADSIYHNGRVYTVDPEDSWAQAIAVKNGRLLAVGSDQQAAQFRGEQTVDVDLQGRMVMPGIHDMHLHPLKGSIKKHYECSFSSALGMDDILQAVADCAAQLEPGQWLRGGQWPSHLLKSERPPTRQLLDAITTEHPVFLLDWALHNAWVNSHALERLGIVPETANPPGGEIQRDPNSGLATGVLLDNAAYDAMARLPAYSPEQNATAAALAIDEFLSLGITAFKDAMTTSDALTAYRTVDQEMGLKARVHTSLAWKSSWSTSHDEELANIEARASYASPMLRTEFAKIMLDGVPLTRTSALLEPYLPGGGHGEDFRGELMFDVDELNGDVAWLDAQGLTIKIHATGDRSARVALDAIEYARRSNGDSGLLHEISHAQFLDGADLPRFRDLGVAAEMCPILWYPTASDDARAAVLGAERAGRMWPMRSLIDSGALVFYGSDWPAVVPNPNPWPGIEAMVTRRNPYTDAAASQWPEQAISLAEAVRVVTINGAAAGKSSSETGSLEAGKAADFIVLDRNIFEVPIEQVGDTRVLLTVVSGAVRHRSGALAGEGSP